MANQRQIRQAAYDLAFLKFVAMYNTEAYEPQDLTHIACRRHWGIDSNKMACGFRSDDPDNIDVYELGPTCQHCKSIAELHKQHACCKEMW